MSDETATPLVRFYGTITRNQLIDSLLALEDKDLAFSIVARQFQPRLMEEPKAARPAEGCIHAFEKRAFVKDHEYCSECGMDLGVCQHRVENGACIHCGTKVDDDKGDDGDTSNRPKPTPGNGS